MIGSPATNQSHQTRQAWLRAALAPFLLFLLGIQILRWQENIGPDRWAIIVALYGLLLALGGLAWLIISTVQVITDDWEKRKQEKQESRKLRRQPGQEKWFLGLLALGVIAVIASILVESVSVAAVASVLLIIYELLNTFMPPEEYTEE